MSESDRKRRTFQAKKSNDFFGLKEALEIIDAIQPEKAYLTHISHHLGLHDVQESLLPKGVSLAYDGLEYIV